MEVPVTIAPKRIATLFADFSPVVFRILIHSLLFGLAASISDVLFNFYLDSLGYGNEVAGQMNSIFRAAGVIFGIPVGMLIDKRGARRVLMFSITAYGASWLALLASTDIRVIAPVYFLVGAANIATYTAIIPLLSSVIEAKQRASFFGINAGATVAVGFIGSLFGGALPSLIAPLVAVAPTDQLAYRLALISVSLIGFLAIIPLLGFSAAATKHHAAGHVAPVSTGHKLPFMRLVLFASQGFLLGLGGGMVVPFQNLFFREQFNLPDAQVGLILAISAFAMGLGSFIGGPLAKRFGLRRAAAWTRFLAAPSLLLMLVPNLWVSAAAYYVSRLVIGVTFPLADALVMQSVPVEQRGTSTSLSSMLWSFGWSGAALMSGYIQRDSGFYWVFIASGIAYVVSGISFYLIPFKDDGH
jgi:MFS family permease